MARRSRSQNLVWSLPEHRHVVWHFTRANGTVLNRNHVRRLARRGVTVRDVHWSAVVDQEVRARTLDGFRPDVVIFHWWGNEPWTPWICATDNEPVRPRFVCVMHSSGKTLHGAYDRYVVVADSQRQQIAMGRDPQVWLIPNAVNSARYRAPSRAASSRDGHPFVVGSLARLRVEKMPADLVSRAIGWNVPGLEWRFAGDGGLRADYEEQAHAARTGQFRFLGHIARRAVPGFLSDLDVLCHMVAPSVRDTNPIAVIEALAAGVPVVSEARGGLPTLIEHGVNGLLGRDPDDVGRLLRMLASDRAQVRRLAAGARDSAQRFDRQAQIAAYRQLLASLEPARDGAHE